MKVKEVKVKIFEKYYNFLLKLSKKENIEFNDLINTLLFVALLEYAYTIEEKELFKQDKLLAKINKAIKSTIVLWGE